MMMPPPIRSLLLLAMCSLLSAVTAMEPDTAPAIKATGLHSALAVTVGTTAELDQQLLKQAPGWLLLSLPGDSKQADQRREVLSASDQGRAMVHPLLSPEVPVFTRAAAVLVVDADALGELAPSDASIAAALRPYGTSFVKRGGSWTKTVAGWPETIGNNPHWLGTADFSGQIPDQEMDHAHSLRWQTARHAEVGVTTMLMSHGIVISRVKESIGWKTNMAPAAFDAFTGLKLWSQPTYREFGNYAIVMDDTRVIIAGFPAEGARTSQGNQRTPEQAQAGRKFQTGGVVRAHRRTPDALR